MSSISFFDFYWSVCEDQHGVIIFSIVLESIQTSDEDHDPKWILNKASWVLFHYLCDQILIVGVPFPFSVKGRIWNSIVPVPNHCLFI